MCRIIIASIAAIVLAAPIRAADDTKAAEEKVMEYLKKIDGAERATVTVVKDSVAKAFPKHTFVAVLYKQFPIGREAPKPLKEANVLAVDGDGKDGRRVRRRVHRPLALRRRRTVGRA